MLTVLTMLTIAMGLYCVCVIMLTMLNSRTILTINNSLIKGGALYSSANYANYANYLAIPLNDKGVYGGV